MHELLNASTQPSDQHPIFNNWKVLPEAWYYAFPSRDLKKGQVKSFQLLKQRLAIFRTFQGHVKALDAFCPHMGTDLSLGKVCGENLRCFFHHWEFNGEGRCKKIPRSSPESSATQEFLNANEKCRSQSKRDLNFKLKSYPVCEKYGMIWVYAGDQPIVPVLEVPDLQGKKVDFWLGKKNINRSHHHISMINGLDAQHLQTVHGLSIQMSIDARKDKAEAEYTLKGPVPIASVLDRTMRFLLGTHYSYSMKYSLASIASLTILRDVYFVRKNWIWPRLHMLYAYRPIQPGVSETLPIYVTEKRRGFLGYLQSKIYLWMTYRAYHFLKDEDDKIYDHVRFDSRQLLEIDKTVAHYIDWVNSLSPSCWSDLR